MQAFFHLKGKKYMFKNKILKKIGAGHRNDYTVFVEGTDIICNKYALVISVAFAIVFCVGISLLVPSPSYTGIMKIICGVFVVYTLLSPIKKIVYSELPAYDFSGFAYDENFERIVEESRSSFFQSMSELAKDAIEKEVSLKWGADISIALEKDKVCIYHAKEEYHDDIAEYIRKNYGIDTVFR